MRHWAARKETIIASVGIVFVVVAAASEGSLRPYAFGFGCSLLVLSGLWMVATAILDRASRSKSDKRR